MLTRRRSGATAKGPADGFTLIELVVTVAILGIVMVALVGVVFEYLRVSNSTSTRQTESTDQQFVSAYWQQDVSSLGVHGFTPNSTPQLPEQQSVWTGSAPAGVPAGCAGVANTVIGFAWNEYPSGVADPEDTWTDARVNAAVYATRVAGNQTQLWRTRCGGGSTTSTILARYLTQTPKVTCVASDGTSTSCTSTSPLPATVTITLAVQDKSKGSRVGGLTATCPAGVTAPTGTGYCTTLTGQRRQG